MRMAPLLNVVTGDYTTITEIMNCLVKKIIFDERPAYDEAKELQSGSDLLSKSITVLFLWYET